MKILKCFVAVILLTTSIVLFNIIDRLKMNWNDNTALEVLAAYPVTYPAPAHDLIVDHPEPADVFTPTELAAIETNEEVKAETKPEVREDVPESLLKNTEQSMEEIEKSYEPDADDKPVSGISEIIPEEAPKSSPAITNVQQPDINQPDSAQQQTGTPPSSSVQLQSDIYSSPQPVAETLDTVKQQPDTYPRETDHQISEEENIAPAQEVLTETPEPLMPPEKEAIGELLGEFTATGYNLSIESCGKARTHPAYGITANGYSLVGHTRNSTMTVASDPKVIPLGAQIYIEFKEGMEWLNGIYTARDTGSLIKGNKIDVFMGEEMSNAEVRKSIGVQKVKIYLLKK